MKKLTILVALILLALSAQEALGCVCELDPNPTPEKVRANRLTAFTKATAVFSGEVVSGDLFAAKFKVDKIWKGEEAKEITMHTRTKVNSDGTMSVYSCDFRFVKGEKYLIYAYGTDGELKTDVCSRTSVLKNAEPEMKALDEITPHKSVGLVHKPKMYSMELSLSTFLLMRT